jgi:two-component system KDP operon response regulator KdpE
MTRVLIVEDDNQLARALGVNMRARHHEVVMAANGKAALEAAAKGHFDLIVMDLGLPDIDGVDLIGAIRLWSHTPILVLSARDAESEKVRALDAGADDYLTKPFGIDELLARVRALIRRTDSSTETNRIIERPDFTIDLETSQVRDSAGDPIRLTRLEWGILEILCKNPDRLITSKYLLEQVWGPNHGDDIQTLRVHISQLRRKIEPEPSTPRYIVTELGMGYRFISE